VPHVLRIAVAPLQQQAATVRTKLYSAGQHRTCAQHYGVVYGVVKFLRLARLLVGIRKTNTELQFLSCNCSLRCVSGGTYDCGSKQALQCPNLLTFVLRPPLTNLLQQTLQRHLICRFSKAKVLRPNSN
jgi:hypothetical protein